MYKAYMFPYQSYDKKTGISQDEVCCDFALPQKNFKP